MMPPRTVPASSLRCIGLLGFAAFAVALLLQLSIWPVFEFQRMSIRSEMKWKLLRGVPESDLLTFHFNPEAYADLEFEDGGKEVELDGAMHDIVRTERQANGDLVIHVVRDDAETALLAGLDQRVRRLQEGDASGQEQRRVITTSWPGFHDSVRSKTFVLKVFDRHFPEGTMGTGRTAEAADPGPPRRA